MFIQESSSQLESRYECLNHQLRQIRQHERLINDCWQNTLDRRTKGWLITLNTKAVIEDRHDIDKVTDEFNKLDRQIGIFANRLNGFCYRRRRNLRLKIISGFEIGNKNRLHAHVIAAHDGDVDKTISQMKREVAKQWKLVYQFDEVGFIDVQEIYDMKGIIKYVSEDASRMIKKYQWGSVQPF